MSKKLRMFLSTTMVVVLTIVTYYIIAAFSGGLEALVEKAFGGAVSALTIVGLLLGLGIFGWYTYWLSEHRASSKGSSGLHALASVAILVVAAIIGISWVQWSWKLLWVIPLLAPTLLSAWAISAIAERIYGSRDTETTTDVSVDDILT